LILRRIAREDRGKRQTVIGIDGFESFGLNNARQNDH
jgi:hypothetical protein